MMEFLTTSKRMLNIEEHSFKTIHKSVTIVIERKKFTIDPREHPSNKCESHANNSHCFLEQSSVKQTYSSRLRSFGQFLTRFPR